MFYTSEGRRILRYDVCTDTQLPDFASGLHGNTYALRILPDGSVLVADTVDIHRLDSSGNIIQTYDAVGNDCWFSLNLDPDGTSFWSADFCSSKVHKFNINTGAELLSFNTGTARSTVYGLAVFGEITAAAKYRLELFEGVNPSDGVINPGDAMTAKASTDDSTVTSVQFEWFDPSNNNVRTEIVALSLGSASDTFNPTIPGIWTVVAKFSDGTIIVKELSVSFHVLPESAIGAIAMMGASVGVLAAFMYRKQRISKI